MKICVPTENDNGLEAPVSRHFGMAPYFAFVDSETRQAEFVRNSARGHAAGRCRAVDLVAEHRPDAVLTAEIGPGAFDTLHAAGRPIYRAADGRLDAALTSLAEGRTPEIAREEAVGHSHREGLHRHAGHGQAGGCGGAGRGRNRG